MMCRKIWLILLTLLILGCASNTEHPSKQIKLYEEIYVKSQEIEGDFWKYFGTQNLTIFINNSNSSSYLEAVGRIYNDTITAYNYVNLSNNEKQALLKILSCYGLPLKFPVAIYAEPPIVFIGYKDIIPYPEYIKYLKENHPYFFFKKHPKAIAVVINKPIDNMTKVLDFVQLLYLKGENVTLYYNLDKYGLSSAKVLNYVLNRSDNYVVITENYSIKEVLPLAQALKTIPTHIKSSNATVLVFYSPDCPHCEDVLPYLRNLSVKYPNIHFEFYNVVNNTSLADKYNIFAVPTVIIKVNSKTTRLIGEIQILQHLESILKSIS